MVSQLEKSMEGLIKVFHNYSSKEGDKYKLSKGELKSLLQGELSDFLAVSNIIKRLQPSLCHKVHNLQTLTVFFSP